MELEILSPLTRIDPSAGFAFSPRPAGLAGLRLGLLDSGKRNSRAVLEHLAAAITRTHPAAAVVVRTKPSASRSASPELLADLRAQCDAVIAGIGD